MKFIARIGLALVTAGASEGFIIGRQIANNIMGNIEEKETRRIVTEDEWKEMMRRNGIDIVDVDRTEVEKIDFRV